MPSFTEFVADDEFEVAVSRLCFGRPAARRRRGTGSRPAILYRFDPGQIFGVVWQRWHPDGRQHRTMAIVEATNRAIDGFALPGISRPVIVHAMMDQGGPAGQGGGVDRLLLLVQSIQRAGMDPANAPSAYWRPASYQIMIQQRPRLPRIPPTKSA